MGRAAHVLCEGKWGFGVREGMSQGVCGYLWEMHWQKGRDGPRFTCRTVCVGAPGDTHRGVKPPTVPHIAHKERQWWQTQTGEESVKNTSIHNRWFVPAESEWSPGAIQICGRCIYNLYWKHRPGCSYFACMSERFLMWNYSTFTSQVWFKVCIDQWFNLS